MSYSNLGRSGFVSSYSLVYHKGKLGQELEVGTEAETGRILLIGLLSDLLNLFFLCHQDHLQGSECPWWTRPFHTNQENTPQTCL